MSIIPQISGPVSQVRNARPATRARPGAPSQPPASLALFSLCPDSPRATAARGVIRPKQ